MPNLAKRKLGRTGLDVTVLGFGAMELRGNAGGRGRAIEPEQAGKLLNTVLDSGINFIDTSIDYGESEETIGKYISNRRNEYFLASKCGCPLDPPGAAWNPAGHVFTRENITKGVEQSLKRLNTDHLDLIQIHASPSKETLEHDHTVQTLQDLKKAGKIRFIGSSSVLPNIHDHIKMGVFDEFQIPYSALQREHEAAIAEAAKAGAGVVIRGGVAKGVPGEGRGAEDVWKLWDKAKLNDLLNGMTQMEFILRFTISNPDMATTIVGTMNPEHLKHNVEAASKGPLPAAVYAEAKRRLTAAGATA
ncbi:MAG: aldo/keto reductase [Dehalococcoidia bacterium]|nr:aldo/keto reductase [Dehalococcoidia bacterium]